MKIVEHQKQMQDHLFLQENKVFQQTPFVEGGGGNEEEKDGVYKEKKRNKWVGSWVMGHGWVGEWLSIK